MLLVQPFRQPKLRAEFQRAGAAKADLLSYFVKHSIPMGSESKSVQAMQFSEYVETAQDLGNTP